MVPVVPVVPVVLEVPVVPLVPVVFVVPFVPVAVDDVDPPVAERAVVALEVVVPVVEDAVVVARLLVLEVAREVLVLAVLKPPLPVAVLEAVASPPVVVDTELFPLPPPLLVVPVLLARLEETPELFAAERDVADEREDPEIVERVPLPVAADLAALADLEPDPEVEVAEVAIDDWVVAVLPAPVDPLLAVVLADPLDVALEDVEATAAEAEEPADEELATADVELVVTVALPEEAATEAAAVDRAELRAVDAVLEDPAVVPEHAAARIINPQRLPVRLVMKTLPSGR